MALCVRPEQKPDQERFARCAAEFISLMSVKETEPKKTLCAQSTPGYLLMKGFFERASCPRRKTAHIHVRRPPGLQACGRAVGSLEAKSEKRKRKSDRQRQGQARGRPGAGLRRARGRADGCPAGIGSSACRQPRNRPETGRPGPGLVNCTPPVPGFPPP